MVKTGDIVRFLNTTGGGIVTKVEGRLAYVEEDGFETPVLVSEVVVVMPAGAADAQKKGPSLMFDQKAFDAGRAKEPAHNAKEVRAEAPAPAELPVEETGHGDLLSLTLAFEPSDPKRLQEATFNAVLVNDSNYFLNFTFLGRRSDAKGWHTVYQGSVGPNELIDLATYTHLSLNDIERVALQAVAYKKDKDFELQAPVSATRRLDLTKFHKFHCFRSGLYFDTPVLEFPLVSDGIAVGAPESVQAEAASRLAEKYGSAGKSRPKEADRIPAGKKKNNDPAANPNKVLPLVEVDLHIDSLLDNTAGLEPKDMLQLQLDTVRATMKEHARRIGQKIVFIHGKGDGVLRKEVLRVIAREYPKAEVQDASFREYGFGASMVTIH